MLRATTKKAMATNLRTDASGAFNRHTAGHRHIIGKDADFPAEAGRYHMYVSLACPWANASYQMRSLKGLEKAISVSVVHPTWQRTRPDDAADEHCGWAFRSPGDAPVANPLGHGEFECDNALVPDPLFNAKDLRAVYNKGGDEAGPFTTPLIWDKKQNRIVNNESMDILRMLNDNFNDIAEKPEVNLYPAEHEEELVELNKWIYPTVNNGVYRCGFARSQDAYEAAVTGLFESLDKLEEHLEQRRFLSGSKFTWLDLRLYQTLVRFDPVYITYFKTNVRRLVDYPNLTNFVRDVASIPDVRKGLNLRHIKVHYFTSHPVFNTFGIIGACNGPDLDVPHGRDVKFAHL